MKTVREKNTKTIKVFRYPFDRWLSKPTIILLRGEDYEIDSFKMAQQVRNAANDKGLEVSIKTRKHAVSVTVWDHVPQPKGKR